jgi:hypothetical protein
VKSAKPNRPPGSVSAVRRAWEREQHELNEFLDFQELAGTGWRDAGLEALNPDDLAQPAQPLDWVITGVLGCGLHGPFGGKEKTLKTYALEICQVAVASGKAAFNYDPWRVPEARPVLMFVGEGGKEELRRRLQRIARELYGIEDIATLPLYAVVGSAAMSSEELLFKLWERTAEIRQVHGQAPAWVSLDSLYNYHDTEVEVQNLYDRGPMLRRFQGAVQYLCGEDCCLSFVDHFRKSAGDSTALEEYMQSGMGQWAGTWWNAAHREDPDTERNVFKLNVTVGSRAGYGAPYEVDIDLGPFNEPAACYEREMSVAVRRVRQHQKRGSGAALSNDALDAAIFAMVDSGNYTRREVETGIEGAGKDRVGKRVNKLLADRQLTLEDGPHQEGGRTVKRTLLRRQGPIKARGIRPRQPSSES